MRRRQNTRSPSATAFVQLEGANPCRPPVELKEVSQQFSSGNKRQRGNRRIINAFEPNVHASLALSSNTSGDQNTATGKGALASNTTGFGNTAAGHSALLLNTTADGNTAYGFMALLSNTTGNLNTAEGVNALWFNTTGNYNTAIGTNAGYNITGNGNIVLGNSAGSSLTSGDNNIDIGKVGVAGEAKTIRIGTQGTQTKTFIAGIMGRTVPMGMPVFIKRAARHAHLLSAIQG